MPGVWAAERCDCRALRLRRDRAKVAALFSLFSSFSLLWRTRPDIMTLSFPRRAVGNAFRTLKPERGGSLRRAFRKSRNKKGRLKCKNSLRHGKSASG